MSLTFDTVFYDSECNDAACLFKKKGLFYLNIYVFPPDKIKLVVVFIIIFLVFCFIFEMVDFFLFVKQTLKCWYQISLILWSQSVWDTFSHLTDKTLTVIKMLKSTSGNVVELYWFISIIIQQLIQWHCIVLTNALILHRCWPWMFSLQKTKMKQF